MRPNIARTDTDVFVVLVGELDARFEELEIRNGGEGS